MNGRDVPGHRPPEPVPLNTKSMMICKEPLVNSREQLYRDMSPHHMAPLWEVLHALVPPEPATPCAPAFWKYDDVRPFLMRAGEASTAEEAVRRVLILPGGIAPSHRHT